MQSTESSLLTGASLYLDECIGAENLVPGHRDRINECVARATDTVEGYRHLSDDHPYFNELVAYPAGFWCASQAFIAGSVHPSRLLEKLDHLLRKLLSGEAQLDAKAIASRSGTTHAMH